MKVQFKNSFAKDLKKVKAGDVKQQVVELIQTVEKSRTLLELDNVKKLRGGENYYRIRLGEYRVGLIVEKDTVVFVRFLHRKDIYRYFP